MCPSRNKRAVLRANLAVLGRGAKDDAKSEGFTGGYFCVLPASGAQHSTPKVSTQALAVEQSFRIPWLGYFKGKV